MQWHEEQVDTLKAMWSAGKSALEIANKLDCGVSRNSVIGKVHRLGLSNSRSMKRPRGDTGGGAVQRVRSKHAESIPRVIKLKRRRIPIVNFVHDNEIPKRQRKTLLNLENHHCRWPVGDVGDVGFFFCAHPSADLAGRRPYCSRHQGRAWVKHSRAPRPPHSFKLVQR